MLLHSRPAWLFPVPVRPSRFRASARRWSRYNIQIAYERIAPFSFDNSSTEDAVLYYDYQTQLEPNPFGRLGSGRGGIYFGRYVKGVGRTPAAANWRESRDRYHGSGHLSIASALRERLITVVLTLRGLQNTIVPCETVLVRPLSPAEQLAIRKGATSSDVSFAPADGRMCALTVKPADFARPANFVFALNNFGEGPRYLGRLFLDFERYLRPPRDRKNIEGAPAEIAQALEDAFFRALENFERFARAGLLWFYVRGNFTLDGRFLDLETPYFFGSPFVGIGMPDDPSYARQFLGFEEFFLVQYWRRFLEWLHARLIFLCGRGMFVHRESRLFLTQIKREIAARFPRNHLLFQDLELQQRATMNLSSALQLGPSARIRLRRLARSAFQAIVYSAPYPIPDQSWHGVDFQPAPAHPIPMRYYTPEFFEPKLTPDAENFADALQRLSAIQNVASLLDNLSRYRPVRPSCDMIRSKEDNR